MIEVLEFVFRSFWTWIGCFWMMIIIAKIIIYPFYYIAKMYKKK